MKKMSHPTVLSTIATGPLDADCHIQIKDANSISGAWQVCHVIMYSATAALSLANCVAFYVALSNSRLGSGPNYYCYLYNTVLMIHEQSRYEYRLHLVKEDIWYENDYCHNVFTYPLKMFVFATMWTTMCLVFGHGGTYSESIKFFGTMVEQWRMVFWAVLFNSWCVVMSFLAAMWLTDGYQKFSATISSLPANDEFRKTFNHLVHPYYFTSIVLYWCLTVLCMLNFLVMFYRYVMGIDFQVNFGDDNKDLKKAGPSDYNK